MRKISKQNKEIIRRATVYAVMGISTVVVVILITFLVLGFRFDIDEGQVERYAFLQFSSTPSGATVLIDGSQIGQKTPSKASIKPGTHKIQMQKTGYQTWTKTVTINPGTLTWLNYTLFVPKTTTNEVVASYEHVSASLQSPKGRSLLVQYHSETPAYDLIEIDSSTPKITKLVIPTEVYSEALTPNIIHSFGISNWDDSGRYVLIKHNYGEKTEWLVMDTQNVALSKNITQTFDIAIESIDFSGTNGNNYFAIENSDLRKLDLAAGTISRVLVSNIKSMYVYESNIVVYASNLDPNTSMITVGLYRDGEDNPYSLATVPNSQVRVATTNYFNEDYVAYSQGRTVTVLGGNYPTANNESTTSLRLITSFDATNDIKDLDFSPTGQYVMAQSEMSFSSYDLEYSNLFSSLINCAGVALPISWLDENYISSTCGGSLVIKEFDGANQHVIGNALSGQAAVLSHNGRYLYSIGKSATGYDLQRVRMILP